MRLVGWFYLLSDRLFFRLDKFCLRCEARGSRASGRGGGAGRRAGGADTLGPTADPDKREVPAAGEAATHQQTPPSGLLLLAGPGPGQPAQSRLLARPQHKHWPPRRTQDLSRRGCAVAMFILKD